MGIPRTLSLVAALAVALAVPCPAAAQRTLKLATLAPEGSSWMKLMHEWDKAVQKRTHSRVRLKFQPGAVAGDERDMVRLMRQGRVHGAALTGQGVGLLQPEVRVLELPFLIRSDAELDHLRRVMGEQLRQRVAERGFVVLAWGDAGWIHVFSERALHTRAEFQKAKVWAWTDDPIVRALLQAFGVNGVPLGVPDVLPALTTGQVDVVYGSPLTTLTLGWYRKVKYIIDVPLVYATGAVVLSKSEFDRLEPEDQQALLETARAMEAKLLRTVREGNVAAMVQLKKAGIQTVKLQPAVVAEYQTGSLKVWKQLAGTVYSREALDQVTRILSQFRAGKR
ncbi:MAG: TRAP transporter substrate-binding protein DctP [Deltaproteobacteria bacterium]|nr:TRAP transporter substrate-binding protein DctP [Deltaproteobacteria bacterium]